MDEILFGSYKGKLWSEAVQKCFEAPFPEVAVQHLLMRVYQRSCIDTLEEVLSKKREAHTEREAISPMNIVSRVSGDDIPPFTDENIRQLQYVKVFDVEKMLQEARENFPKPNAEREAPTPQEQIN